MDRFQKLSEKVLLEFPKFQVRVMSKTWLGTLMRWMSVFTKAQVGTVTTTIGSTIYVPDDWDAWAPDARYGTLRHELMHIRQFHSWPLGSGAPGATGFWHRVRVALNHVMMGFAYIALMPALWTMRARFEREGYTQTLLVHRELYGEPNQMTMESKATWMAELFGGPSYFWMWRKAAAQQWAMDTQRKINAGMLWNPRDRVD